MFLAMLLMLVQLCVQAVASATAALKVPPFLNCEGPTFDPVWSAFRRAAVENAEQGYPPDSTLQMAAALLIHRFEPLLLAGSGGWVVHLRSAATGDMYQYKSTRSSASATDSDAPRRRLFNVSVTNASEHAAQAIAALFGREGDSETDPLSFCLYGYIQALFIEFSQSSRIGSSSCGSGDRRGLLQVAEQLMGHTTQETNFLESSGWPVTSLDLHLSLYSDVQKQDAASLCHTLYSRELLPSNQWLGWPQRTRAQRDLQIVDPQARTADRLRLAAFGLHVSSTLEPVSALRAAVGDGVQVLVSYFGHPCYGSPRDKQLRHACIYKCEMLGEPCEDDAVAHVLRGMFNTSGFYEELPWSISNALHELASARKAQPAFRDTDLLVCSGPWVLCYLLDILAPDTPLVHPICSQLLWGAPRDEQARAMLLGHARSMVRNQKRWVVACNGFVAAQCLYQTGVELPIVPRVAMYLPSNTTWSAEALGGKWREVLVLRSRYWHRLPGQYFMDVLESYLRVNEARYNMTFTLAASMGPEELPPSEIARHRSVVLVPNDLTVFAFIEAYAMHIPVFVPTPEWLYRLRRTVPFGFLQVAESLPDIDFGSSRSQFTLPPFLSADGYGDPQDLLAFVNWQRLSELHAYPAVQQFGSVPELLEGILFTDLHSVSRTMAAHVSFQRKHVLDDWSGAVRLLVEVDTVVNTAAEPRAAEADMAISPKQHLAQIGEKADARRAVRAELNCDSDDYAPEWARLRESLRINAADGFPVDWGLWRQAKELWEFVQMSIWEAAKLAEHGSLSSASALFHQVLVGSANPQLLAAANHCHYGLVAALFILARHCLANAAIQRGLWRYKARDVSGGGAQELQWDGCADHALIMTAIGLLGDGAALDFLEDSDWPLSALDLAALEEALRERFADSHGFGVDRFERAGLTISSRIEKSVPWLVAPTQYISRSPRHFPIPSMGLPPERSWQMAIVGAHPSLSMDIAEVVRQAVGSTAEQRFYGMSCPQHHAASHHCTFRCEVLGQCENDPVYARVLGQMLDWAEFSVRSYDVDAVTQELAAIIRSDRYWSEAEFVICTGPFVLCGMVRKLLLVPMLVYLGLELTYLAAESVVDGLLMSARSAASLPGFHAKDATDGNGFTDEGDSALSVVVATDLVRAAQFHHATGVWSTVVPPLSLYLCTPSFEKQLGGCGTPRPAIATAGDARRALAVRSELWRRAAFGPALRGLLDRLAPPRVEFQQAYLSYPEIARFDAVVLVPWDNDVMTFYELYHAGVPILVPCRQLMVKWLPGIRWGSLELDNVNTKRLNGVWTQDYSNQAGESPFVHGLLPWFDQTSLSVALAGGAIGWVGMSDYYRFPDVLEFSSVAGLLSTLRTADLVTLSASAQSTSEAMRADALEFYQRLLAYLLVPQELPPSLPARKAVANSVPAPPRSDASDPVLNEPIARSLVFSSDAVPSQWQTIQGGGTCRNGFLRQADFDADVGSSCKQLCEETPGCVVAAFNGLCCMLYNSSCDTGWLRRDGERADYVAWRRLPGTPH